MKKIVIISMMLLTFSCKTQQNVTSATIQIYPTVVNGKIFTSVYQQRAAEYKALCLQAYNIAKSKLDESLKQQSLKPRAVITDLDETVFDNSPYAVKRALAGKDYDQTSWQEWTALGIADTLAGSYSFFKFAAAQNVEVFYITNRLEAEREGTMKNLQRYGFPYADKDHLLLKGSTSSKEERRQTVTVTHEIVLLLGDNLADFSPLFDNKKATDARAAAVLQNATIFGDKFIVLPNSNYGDWEGAIYNYKYNLSPLQKDSAIKSNLKGY